MVILIIYLFNETNFKIKNKKKSNHMIKFIKKINILRRI
jgi:hypothetical protein